MTAAAIFSRCSASFSPCFAPAATSYWRTRCCGTSSRSPCERTRSRACARVTGSYGQCLLLRPWTGQSLRGRCLADSTMSTRALPKGRSHFAVLRLRPAAEAQRCSRLLHQIQEQSAVAGREARKAGPATGPHFGPITCWDERHRIGICGRFVLNLAGDSSWKGRFDPNDSPPKGPRPTRT